MSTNLLYDLHRDALLLLQQIEAVEFWVALIGCLACGIMIGAGIWMAIFGDPSRPKQIP